MIYGEIKALGNSGAFAFYPVRSELTRAVR
jgi:hypothetical protein